ncbi:hypothetical protein AT6N2_C3076 [Agrobacterium tumefaciens]|nr:hypothetical protein AT6N2_C3076 [Agrobacterium tumefaciens]
MCQMQGIAFDTVVTHQKPARETLGDRLDGVGGSRALHLHPGDMMRADQNVEEHPMFCQQRFKRPYVKGKCLTRGLHHDLGHVSQRARRCGHGNETLSTHEARFSPSPGFRDDNDGCDAGRKEENALDRRASGYQHIAQGEFYRAAGSHNLAPDTLRQKRKQNIRFTMALRSLQHNTCLALMPGASSLRNQGGDDGFDIFRTLGEDKRSRCTVDNGRGNEKKIGYCFGFQSLGQPQDNVRLVTDVDDRCCEFQCVLPF